MSAHAILSPSGASRWMVCTPSARFEQNFADSSGNAAKEGTLAHSLGEWLLKEALKKASPKKVKAEIAKIKKHELYDKEMLVYMKDYRDFVMEQYSEAIRFSPDAQVYLEEQFDMSEFIPEGFGTMDVTITSKYVLYITDLKYGKGVPVSAEGNKQLRIYALGALERFGMLYDFETVRMTIYQPRLDSITTVDLSVAELQEWADAELRPLAQLAWEGKGEYTPSADTCRFCRGKARCEALANHLLELEQHEYKLDNYLTDAGILEALEKAPLLVDWANKVKEHALTEALAGHKWPGWKLVEGRSVRKITNEEKVAEVLRGKKFTDDEIFSPRKLVGIGEIEKLIGKHEVEEAIGRYLIKPSGAPALVEASDKRPEYSRAASDFANIVIEEDDLLG